MRAGHDGNFKILIRHGVSLKTEIEVKLIGPSPGSKCEKIEATNNFSDRQSLVDMRVPLKVSYKGDKVISMWRMCVYLDNGLS